MGLAPSANLNPGRHALYEPVHGSAPDLVGTASANPMATILSVALLFGHAGAGEAAQRIEQSVDAALAAGVRTPDLNGDATTEDVGRWVASHVKCL